MVSHKRVNEEDYDSDFGPATKSLRLKKVCGSPDAISVVKRLQRELKTLMTAGEKAISAYPDSGNMFFWKGTIKGPDETVYSGLVYKLKIKFPLDYPFNPPIVIFETPCFHPNVADNGTICLDILQDKWSALYDVRTVLLSIQSLLTEPNNESPLNNVAAKLWSNQKEFKVVVYQVYNNTG